MGAPLAIGGRRLAWTDLPPDLRREIETAAGSAVVAAQSQPGGFSPGLASVLRLADGRSVFVKAVHPDRNPDSPDFHRREAQVLAALPPTLPVPRLLWSYDDGRWVALMTEAVRGRTPAQPWTRADLAAFLTVAADLAELLTPHPIEAPPIAEKYRRLFTGWRTLAAAAGGPDPARLMDRLDPWARDRLDRLAGIEAGWEPAATGDTLLHGDLRADNVLLTGDGAVVVDWPGACVGAAWVDLLCALPSVAMHGGGDPQRLWAAYRPARTADPDAVTAVLVAITGFFVHGGLQPALPGIPLVREFQRAQGAAGLAWLRQRLGG